MKELNKTVNIVRNMAESTIVQKEKELEANIEELMKELRAYRKNTNEDIN